MSAKFQKIPQWRRTDAILLRSFEEINCFIKIMEVLLQGVRSQKLGDSSTRGRWSQKRYGVEHSSPEFDVTGI